MTQDTIRSEILSELAAGHLMKAQKLLEDNTIPVDTEIREEAVKACISSLKRHFHWCIPIFVKAFGIADDGRLNTLAAKMIFLAFRSGQPLIAGLAAQTFNIQLDPTLRTMVENAQADVVRSMTQAGAVVVDGGSIEYNFTLP